MSKPWGKIGAWAADSERAEAEELAAAATAPSFVPAATFPSLREAASTKQKKKTKMSLQEFTKAASSPTALTPSEMLRLPTGPKERSADEILHGGRLGGGFSSYGRGPGRPRDDGDTSWGAGGGRRSYGGGFENEDRPSRVSENDNMPSRADEADNWAMGKKTLPSSFDSSGRNNNKYTSLGSGLGGSRSDDTDNWAVGKKSLPAFDSSGRTNKYTTLGSGPGGSRSDDVDNWGAGKMAPSRSTFGSSFRDAGPGGMERTRLVLDPPKKEVGPAPVGPAKTNKPSPFGAARPREEVLAEKGLDWKKLDSEIEAKKTSRPTSSHSSRPTSSHSNRSEGVGVTRPKVNPFGDAKPREVLLQEKGLDWRKIDLDLDHRRVDRPETETEKILKEEIDHFKKELAKQSASNATRESDEGATGDLHDMIISKERDLELLIRDLDNKVRFGPRVNERPGSGAGRVSGPPSRSESFDESRSMEFMERPRSRGTGGDMWSRQSDDRRTFQGGMERGGFMANRGMDRPRSRERW